MELIYNIKLAALGCRPGLTGSTSLLAVRKQA